MRLFPDRRRLTEETEQNTWLARRRRWMQRRHILCPELDELDLVELEAHSINIGQAVAELFMMTDRERAAQNAREIPSPGMVARHLTELEKAGQGADYHEVKARQDREVEALKADQQ